MIIKFLVKMLNKRIKEIDKIGYVIIKTGYYYILSNVKLIGDSLINIFY